MTEAPLQILLLLAYLAIGLISVTFPIYALCVTYLKQEQSEYKQERKKRIANLKQTIDNLNKQLSGEPVDSARFKRIQAEIKDYRAERWRARLLYLTSTGAVLLPIAFLLVALALSCLGIYSYYEGIGIWVFQFIAGSCVFIGSAVFALCRTILAVEYAALRRARTVEFDVCYSTREETAEVKVRKKVELDIGFSPIEEDIENVTFHLFFPPEIEVKEGPENSRITVQPDWHEYAGFTMIAFNIDFMPRETYKATGVSVLPKKVGIYRIPVKAKAKGIYEYRTELTLEVVE